MQNGGFNGGGGAQRICQYNSGGHNGISYPDLVAVAAATMAINGIEIEWSDILNHS